jgi:hypothetical protein
MIISREQWGARRPGRTPSRHRPVRVVVHHSYRPTIPGWGGDRTMRAIQDYHMDNNEWADIGYHYVISPDGTIYAGRDPEHLGAHCAVHVGTPHFGNRGSIGICVIGDFDHEEPTTAQLASLHALLADLRQRFGVAEVRGHFEAGTPPPKTCPGKSLAELIGRGREWAAAFPAS